MKISLLVPNLATNCMGRAHLLAGILKKRYEVELVGPLFEDNLLWKPLSNSTDIEIKSVEAGKAPWAYRNLARIPSLTAGDVLYAVKPLFSSYGIGLLARQLFHKPLVLDIDDWEVGFVKANIRRHKALARIRYLMGSTLLLYDERSYWNPIILEKLVSRADAITVSGNFLRQKYGGTIIRHGRDENSFNPQYFDNASLRKKYNIDMDDKVIMFFGTPHPYKGLEDLLAAVARLNNPQLLLVVVGISEDYPHSVEFLHKAERLMHNRFKPFPTQTFDKVPEFIAMADIMVIPQREDIATTGQTPAKVFDAMAMAKPVIATNVSDLPEILGDCGWTVEAGNSIQLAETISLVLNNRDEADRRGKKGREKFMSSYSWSAIEEKLFSTFDKFDSKSS